MMIGQAISLAFHEYEQSDPRIADTLNDYGFFLLNSDNIEHCVSVHLVSTDHSAQSCTLGRLNSGEKLRWTQ